MKPIASKRQMAHDSFFWSVLHQFTKAHHIVWKENEQSDLAFSCNNKITHRFLLFADDIGQQHSCLQNVSNFINNCQPFRNKLVEIIQFGTRTRIIKKFRFEQFANWNVKPATRIFVTTYFYLNSISLI